jgi:cyclopropane-fatty-acyl-phospholipid synthase
MIARAPAWIRIADRTRHAIRRFAQRNDPRHAARNIAHHYDLPDEFYDLFLDPARQYSCAYFEPGDDLEMAQRRKMRHISAKLHLEKGQKILDIGCGWGGLAHYMAGVADVDVVGITLSRQQLKAARERSWRTGTAPRVDFSYQDWRSVSGPFDRLVSVGMFEHVGITNYQAYFSKIRELLTERGVALVHTIGRSDGPGFTNPFIARHIFPGGYFPALSEILPAVERSGAILTDVEILRLHYADTLKAWRERFVARWAEAAQIAGERFCRGWEFYLAGAEAAFRCQGLVVFQLQLARRIDALPLTRDYITRREAEFAMKDGFGDDRPPNRAKS